MVFSPPAHAEAKGLREGGNAGLWHMFQDLPTLSTIAELMKVERSASSLSASIASGELQNSPSKERRGWVVCKRWRGRFRLGANEFPNAISGMMRMVRGRATALA